MKSGQRLIFTLTTFLAIIIFFVDILTPRSIEMWLLYFAPIWGISKSGSKRNIYAITSICTLFLISGYFLSQAGVVPGYFALLSRIIGVIACCILALLLIRQKQAERKFEESENLFRQTFELASVGITHIFPDGKWIRFNDKFSQIVGYTRDELLKLTPQDITHPDDLPEEQKLKQKLLAGEIKDFSLDKRYIRKDGKIIWASINCSVTEDKYNGSAHIIVVIKDITDQKELENSLIKQTSSAEELSDFNMEILESSPFGIAVYEESGNCNYANEAFCNIIGATRTQALAQNFHFIKSWKESGVYELAIAAIETSTPQIKELRIVTTFGKMIWAEWRMIPFSSGGILNLLVILNDVTAYRQAERRIEIQIIRAEKLSGISKTLSEQALDLDSVLNVSAKLIGEISGDCVSIRLISEDGNSLLTPAIYCENKEWFDIYKEMIENIPQTTEEGITSGVIRTGMPVYINNINDISEIPVLKKEYNIYAEKLSVSSIMILPLIQRKKVLGVLAFARMDRDRPFTDDEQSFLMEVADRIAATLANVKLYHERLTEIEERKKIEKKLRESQESYSALFNTKTNAIVHFKVITDDNDNPLNLQFIEVNNAYESIINLKKEDVEGKMLTEIFPGIENTPQDYIGRYGKIGIEGGELVYEDYFEPSNLWVSNYIFSPGKGKIIVIFNDITKRKRVEEALLESEEQYSALFNTQSNAIGHFNIIIDEIGKPKDIQYVKINDAYEKIMNLKREKVIGKMLTEVFPGIENARQDYIGRYGKVGTEGGELFLEDYFEPNKLWISIYVFSPKKNKIIVIFTDITERKKAEEALQESEERQRLVLEAANLGIWDLDLINNVTLRSFRYDQIWGYTEPQKEWGFEIAMRNVVPEDRPLIIDAFNNGIKSGLLYHENRVIWPDGSIHWIRAYGRFRYNEENKPVRVIGIVEDITERKKIEEALKESEEKFSSAFRSNPNALVLSRIEDGKIFEVNETFLNLFGYTIEEVIGNSSIVLHMFASSEDRDKAVNLLRKDGKIRDFEIHIKTKTGEEKTALLSSELMEINGELSILTILQDITELRLERMRWQAIVRGISDEVWICDAEGKIDLVNLGNIQVMGLKEFRNKSLKEILDEIEIMDLNWQIRKGKETPLLRSLNGEIVRGEEIMRHKSSGIIRYRQFSSAPMRNPEGKIIGAVTIVRDITEQKENEQKLKAALQQLHDSEAKLLDAQKLGNFGSYTLDVKTGNIEWSDQMYEIWEVDRNKPIPNFTELCNIIHPDDKENLKNILSQEIKENDKVETEFRIVFPGNRIKYIHIITRGYFEDAGNLVKRQGVEIDITERKVQQQKLEYALREIKISEEKMLDAQKLAHVGSFSYDLQTGKSEWSAETYNIYEWDTQKEAPSIDVVRSFVHPEDRDRVIEAINYGMDNNKVIDVEYRLLLHGNKIKYVNYIGRPVYDSNGKPSKRIGAIMDITERKLNQVKLEGTLKELQRSNQELEQFAYIASHDLQEPIRMVRSYTELLSRKYSNKLDENANEYFGFITESSSRMQQLISDLLKYSRIATQAKPFEEIDCNEILSHVVQDLRFVIQDTNAEINFSELPIIKGDWTQIRQVFQNLLQNAIKFRNSNNPVIDIKSEKRKDVWLFSVRDNGIGIEQKYLERIFIIFQRLHTREEYPGTGIGLAIVKKIIERHGGEVCVDSEPGQGSTFYFTLPIAA